MIKHFLDIAGKDEVIYISDVRDYFNANAAEPFHLEVTLYDGRVKKFPLMLPKWSNEEEYEFVLSYINAMVFNILSTTGADHITIYLKKDDADMVALAASLDATFQTAASKAERGGYGTCLNVNERVLAVLSGHPDKKFAFVIEDITEEKDMEAKADELADAIFADLPGRAKDKVLMGIDVGGTDIKLAAAVNGHLALCKEYDWFPTAFATAKQLIDPIITLTRLMRGAASLIEAGKADAIDMAAFDKDASLEYMNEACDKMEALLGDQVKAFDAIGISFPDVIIHNRIVGGETTKTRGMRENKEVDYEEEFAKLTGINELLAEYVTDQAHILIANDGPMSAFTTAVEVAAAGADVTSGFLAYSLGTELGTGWIMKDGSIPNAPIEVYNLLLDLGSKTATSRPHADIQSNRNVNNNLPGSLQKYDGQSGVFRLAAKWFPEKQPEIWEAMKAQGFVVEKDGMLLVPTEPVDMRKGYLEYVMKLCREGNPIAQDIFREIGTYMAKTYIETDYMLDLGVSEYTLFGRLVKYPECFALIKEGAESMCKGITVNAADSDLAITDLMKELEADPAYTVAQFAQAIGGMFFGCIAL